MERTEILKYRHRQGETIIEKVSRLPDFGKKTFIICDEFFKSHIEADFYVQANEQNKSLEFVSVLVSAMHENKVARDWTLIAIGGGVLGDLVGFVSSIYMRGLDWIMIPTTILSQVDSCIGGKTAVNTGFGKNLIGSFHHPKKVFLYNDFLKTLNANQIQSGWGEILKYSLISDMEKVEIQFKEIPNSQTIENCLKMKAHYIEQDELDNNGIRQILNYGHTLAHGLEKVLSISHGEAVFWGIMFERFLNQQSITDFIHDYEPLSQSRVLTLDATELSPYLSLDKKGGFSFFNTKFELYYLSSEQFIRSWKEFTQFLKS